MVLNVIRSTVLMLCIYPYIDRMYNYIVSSRSNIQLGKVARPVFNQIERWNENCKLARSEALGSFLLWRSYNSPKCCPIYDTMRRTISHFKLLLR